MTSATDRSQPRPDYWLDDRHEAYHARQFASPYRSTVALGAFVTARLPDREMAIEALDVGCGAGANMYHLGRLLPAARWTGLDASSALFDLGARLLREQRADPAHYRFVRGDFYRLTDTLPSSAFDVVFSIQTLSWLPDYDVPLRQLATMCRLGGTLFITSLFTDSLVDARISITQYADDADGTPLHEPTPYNVYCLARFERACRALGASAIEAADFDIDVDLPPPAGRHMGTFTRLLADGRRLQQSGPLLMPWKFLCVRF